MDSNNVIIFMGMSGVGKSHYSKRINKDYGHRIISVDDMIAEHLGLNDVYAVREFFGEPYEEKYKENSKIYLDLEERFTNEALDIAENSGGGNIIIDTTGSVIYLSDETLRRISKFKNRIYLDADEGYMDKLIEKYFADPKPVIWGELNNFTKDNYLEKIKEQYPKLLKYRSDLYRKHCNIVIPFEDSRDGLLDVIGWMKKLGTR